MIQSIIGTSFTGGGGTQPSIPTFVASNYNPQEDTTITFTISGITGVSEGTLLYWWIDGTSPSSSRAYQFVENKDNDTLQLYTDGSGTLGGTFSLTPNQSDISFNIYIGYGLYSGFLNLLSDVFVKVFTNNFTIEWWQKMEASVASVGDNDVLFSVGYDLRFTFDLVSNGLSVWTGDSGVGANNQNIPGLYNTWVHFAIVRDSNVLKLYKNGNILFNYTSLVNNLIQNYYDDLQIAKFVGSYFQGYITNFHFLKGVAKYNNNFTPSTTPLTEITGTKLLLLASSSNTTFIDATGNHVASVIGGTWSSQSPFLDGSGSLYFGSLNVGSGTPDYLGFPGSVDWAIDYLPFDVTANWSLTTPEVVDKASFRTFLESGEDGSGNSNNLADVVIKNFSLVDGRLTCNLSASGTILNLNNLEITDVDRLGDIGIETLNLIDNQIVTFNPSQTLPNSLRYLNLTGNQIVTFDPSIALPNSLQYLFLTGNQIVTFDPSIALPNSLQYLFLTGNQIVTFDPSIALPNSLQYLYLDGNQMTTAGYTTSESWANAMSVIFGRGEVQFTGNINSVSGTNLQTILISKGWTVTVGEATTTNNFTIEWWQKMTDSVSSYDRLFDVGSNPGESIGFSEEIEGNRLIVWTGGGFGSDYAFQNISDLYNTWVHFAIVRNSNTLELYKDGTRLFYNSSNRLILDNTSDLEIGGGSNQKFNGYLTNFHFLKGVVKYNGNFTPSTTPLNPADYTETKLLLSVTSSNTTFIDSTGNHIASVIGGTWSSESPFSDGSGSIYFDGVSTYLNFPGSNDWAIDL